jgi:histone-lysine N-methyltransferase SETMAR
MVTVFFSGVKLISQKALPPGARFTQEYFINSILPDMADERGRISYRIRRRDFALDMDNSMYHNGRKVPEQLDNLKLGRVSHPSYSPDLSPCDFWLFRILKETIRNRMLHAVEETFTG